MGYKFNPFSGKLDTTDSPDGVFNSVEVNGDITLDDGIAGPVTTLQTITPTQNNTISLPNATGTLALVAGSSGQPIYNNAGAYAGLSTATIGATGNITLSLNGAASTPPVSFTGTWFTGGTGTTTKPQLLIEPTGTTSTAWSTSGTGLGVNAASGFAGRLLDLQVNGTSNFNVSSTGAFVAVGGSAGVNNSGFIGGWSAGAIGFTSSANWTAGVTLDVLLRRDAANTLALRNDTSAQTFRVYNTYTSSTNYELGKLEWSSNAFRVGTEKGSGGGTARNLELQTDGTTRVTIGATTGHLTGSNDVYCASGAFIGCNLRSLLSSPADGVMRISNYAVNDFDRLQFGGTTTSFPALKRSSATLQARLADDSGYTTIDAQHRLQGTAPATASSTGTAGDIRYDADYIYVCTATNTWKRAALATW